MNLISNERKISLVDKSIEGDPETFEVSFLLFDVTVKLFTASFFIVDFERAKNFDG